jgi:diacylglycerol kinase (ATP)
VSRVLAVVNPAAGGGRPGRVWAELSPTGMECVRTERPGHATEIAREAAAGGYERVVAVGGDGTVSEVTAGLVGSETALGIVPCGTGNDFSRALGVPSRPSAALRLALGGSARPIDVGRIDIAGRSRWFANVAGCGFDAEVVRRLRRGQSSLVYLFGVLRTVTGYKPRRMRVEFDGRMVERRAVGVAVANGPRYGAGLRIAPRASLDDGLFDVCVVGALGAAGILGLLPFLYLGAHARYPRVELFRARSVAIEGDAGCQADGELVGDLPARFEVVPGALRVVAP